VAKIPSESMAKDQILKMDLSQKWTKSFLHEQFGTTSASSPTYFLTAKQAALFAVSWGHRCRSSCSLPGMLTSAVNSKARFTPIELLVGMVLLAFHFWACKPSHSVHLFCWSSQFPHTFRGPNFVVFSTCQRTLRHLWIHSKPRQTHKKPSNKSLKNNNNHNHNIEDFTNLRFISESLSHSVHHFSPATDLWTEKRQAVSVLRIVIDQGGEDVPVVPYGLPGLVYLWIIYGLSMDYLWIIYG
jgi:sterol desaturase/sphingolipid hydroxylase (fatty acid hydroxylase superfamily)